MSEYRVSPQGSTFRLIEDGKGARYAGGSASYPPPKDSRSATEDEVADYERKEARVVEERTARRKREAELLDLCGLTHDDFCRFRSVSLEDGVLFVCTRENGIGGRSVGAIKNDNYASSETDLGDSTYEYYTFTVPE